MPECTTANTEKDFTSAKGCAPSELRVKDVMIRCPISVDPGAGFKEAVLLMSDRGIRHLIVADANGKAVGLLTHRDILRYLAYLCAEMTGIALQGVGEVMTTDLTTIGPMSSVSDASGLMLRGRLGCLPVVDERGGLMGIVCRSDLLRVLQAEEQAVLDPSDEEDEETVR